MLDAIYVDAPERQRGIMAQARLRSLGDDVVTFLARHCNEEDSGSAEKAQF